MFSFIMTILPHIRSHCSTKCYRFGMKRQLIRGQRGTIQTVQGYQISTRVQFTAADAVTEVFPWKLWLRNALELPRWGPGHYHSKLRLPNVCP